MSTLHESCLRETLALAGVEEVAGMPPKVLSHGNSKSEIEKTHRETNNKIQECLKSNSLGECIHITGEMRALTDPFHRYLCEEINHKDKDVFRVVYNLPERYMQNPTKILEWNLESWAQNKPERKWYEELRTIYSIANRSVNLYALDTSEEIQYSVFGNEYVLLQEKHKDRATEKYTWLLQSELLNSRLTTKAEELIKKSRDVDGGNYRKFTTNISSIASRRFLTLLGKSSSLSKELLLLDKVVNDFTDSPKEIMDTLNIMGFIKESNHPELVEITMSGRDFIR